MPAQDLQHWSQALGLQYNQLQIACQFLMWLLVLRRSIGLQVLTLSVQHRRLPTHQSHTYLHSRSSQAQQQVQMQLCH
jgi:hypothetical protein